MRVFLILVTFCLWLTPAAADGCLHFPEFAEKFTEMNPGIDIAYDTQTARASSEPLRKLSLFFNAVPPAGDVKFDRAVVFFLASAPPAQNAYLALFKDGCMEGHMAAPSRVMEALVVSEGRGS